MTSSCAGSSGWISPRLENGRRKQSWQITAHVHKGSSCRGSASKYAPYRFLSQLQNPRQKLQGKHYFKRYHASYTSAEELEKTVEREGYENWIDLWNTKKRIAGWGKLRIDLETPTLRPWLLKRKGVNWWELERNPYFFGVDTAGNQLPYIDRILITNVGNIEVYLGPIMIYLITIFINRYI